MHAHDTMYQALPLLSGEGLVTRLAQELQVTCNVGVVTERRTLLIITQVSSGLKKLHMPKFCKYKYLHVKTASLAIVKFCMLTHLWVSNILPPALTMD